MQQMLAIAFVGVYVVLIGVATYLQKPLMKQMDAFQMNALVAGGMFLISVLALVFREHSMPATRPIFYGIGIGVLMGLGSLGYFLGLRTLPVSVAATLAVGYIAITVILAVIVRHEAVTTFKVLGVVLTVGGAALLAAHAK